MDMDVLKSTDCFDNEMKSIGGPTYIFGGLYNVHFGPCPQDSAEH